MRAPPGDSSDCRPLLAIDRRRIADRRGRRSADGYIGRVGKLAGRGNHSRLLTRGHRLRECGNAATERRRRTRDTAQSRLTERGPRPGIRGGRIPDSAVSSNAPRTGFGTRRFCLTRSGRVAVSATFDLSSAERDRRRVAGHLRRRQRLHCNRVQNAPTSYKNSFATLVPARDGRLNICRTPALCVSPRGFSTPLYRNSVLG